MYRELVYIYIIFYTNSEVYFGRKCCWWNYINSIHFIDPTFLVRKSDWPKTNIWLADQWAATETVLSVFVSLHFFLLRVYEDLDRSRSVNSFFLVETIVFYQTNRRGVVLSIARSAFLKVKWLAFFSLHDSSERVSLSSLEEWKWKSGMEYQRNQYRTPWFRKGKSQSLRSIHIVPDLLLFCA